MATPCLDAETGQLSCSEVSHLTVYSAQEQTRIVIETVMHQTVGVPQSQRLDPVSDVPAATQRVATVLSSEVSHYAGRLQEHRASRVPLIGVDQSRNLF